ncbi:MAG: DoxX family protein [Bacteroidota bacterium]
MKKIILFVLSLLFGLLFINSGLNKLFQYMPVPEDMPESTMKVMNALMEIGWLMPLVAIVEIIGGILVITNRFRALGAIMLFPIVIGIVCTHVFNMPEGLPVAIVVLLINLWQIYENREKYMPLVR